MSAGTWQKLDLVARRITPFMITFVLVVLSQVPMHLPSPVPVTPAFAFASIYFWTLHNPDLLPASGVFVIGLLQDILSGVPLGLNAFTMLVGYGIVVSQRRYFFGRSFLVLWWGFAVMAIFIGLLQWMAISLLAGQLLSVAGIVIEQLTAAALYPVLAYFFVAAHRSILRGTPT
jgi:rod shape-determining protein MreD